MNKALIAVLAVAVMTTGCAHRQVRANPDAVYVQGIIVDGKNRDREAIIRDGNECAGIAAETAPAEKAVGGAVAGAVIGALLGAVTYRAGGLSGNNGAGYGAAAGAIGGSAGGAARGAAEYRVVLRNCMIGRGHAPLN